MTSIDKVAIVIPVWKSGLTEYEYISLLQVCRILKKHKIILVTFSKLDVSKYKKILIKEGVNYRIKYFNKKYFGDIEAYNRLMLSVIFYLKFFLYDYILIYQLDCFVFRDDLMKWVKKGDSYTGAPLLKGYTSAECISKVVGVGNGGFSLRRVNHHIKALLIYNYYQKKHLIWKFIYNRDSSNSFVREGLNLFKNLMFNGASDFFNDWSTNEDLFWGIEVKKSFPWFLFPDWKVASQFSIEVQPEYFYKLNKNELPFGCHAWWRYGFDFWMPHISEFGYKFTQPPLKNQ